MHLRGLATGEFRFVPSRGIVTDALLTANANVNVRQLQCTARVQYRQQTYRLRESTAKDGQLSTRHNCPSTLFPASRDCLHSQRGETASVSPAEAGS